MAKKTKPKSKPAKAKGKKVELAASDAVGIISTITITREMKQALYTGLANPNVRLKFSYVGSYKPAKLKKKFANFNKNGKVKLVLTLGGNKTYDAAAQYSTKPFVSLVGVVPTAQVALRKGGVSLNSAGGNQARVDHLIDDLSKPKSKIGLLCNQNSSMNGPEEADWTDNIGMPAANIFHAGKDTTDENDTDTYEAAFTKIAAANMQAVIVSADPFFQETMDELVADANDAGIYFTYPLQDYKKAWEPPATGDATLQGPDLLMAYSQLGTIAASVLLTGVDQGFRSANSATNDI